MKSTEKLAELLRPVAMRRFNLASEPQVRIDAGGGLGAGVKFRVALQDHDVGLIESHTSVGEMLSKAKQGARLIFDHNGSNHTVGYESPKA